MKILFFYCICFSLAACVLTKYSHFILICTHQASPAGQLVFDKLVKACGEVVWKGESILVLKHVQVDPPYGPEDCKIVQRNATGKKALDDGSLERVKKIVAAAATNTSS